jgi:hypothetical protein
MGPKLTALLAASVLALAVGAPRADAAGSCSLEVSTVDLFSGPTNIALPCSGPMIGYEVVDPPDHGVLSTFDATHGAVLYTSPIDFIGWDSFVFQARYEDGLSGSSRVNVNIAHRGYVEMQIPDASPIHKRCKKAHKKHGKKASAAKKRRCRSKR